MKFLKKPNLLKSNNQKILAAKLFDGTIKNIMNGLKILITHMKKQIYLNFYYNIAKSLLFQVVYDDHKLVSMVLYIQYNKI